MGGIEEGGEEEGGEREQGEMRDEERRKGGSYIRIYRGRGGGRDKGERKGMEVHVHAPGKHSCSLLSQVQEGWMLQQQSFQEVLWGINKQHTRRNQNEPTQVGFKTKLLSTWKYMCIAH